MKLIFGVGINDADYVTSPRVCGKANQCKVYVKWQNMLKRAYYTRSQLPSYQGVSVCSEWHRFSNFKKWHDANYIPEWQLDKDILTDMKEYAPDTCLFVPSWLNSFITDRKLWRGEFPIGVDWSKRSNAFRARCSNPISKREVHLGYFKSKAEAYFAWRTHKMDIAYQLKDLMDAVDPRVYYRVTEIIMRAR